jgi:hypothetical protein
MGSTRCGKLASLFVGMRLLRHDKIDRGTVGREGISGRP